MADWTLDDLDNEEEIQTSSYSPEPEEPSFTATVGAAFRQDNSIYNIYKAAVTGGFRRGAETVRPGMAATLSLMREKFDADEAMDAYGIEGEDREAFAHVNTQREFDNALEFHNQKKEDEKILQDSGFMGRLAASLVAGAADPINYIPVARALKFGTPLTRVAIEGATIGGLSYTARAAANNDFEAGELVLDSVAGGITAGIFSKIATSLSPVFKDTKEAIKNASRRGIERWFEMDENGLTEVSRGPFAETRQKAKRIVWSMFTNSPMFQMEQSGNPELKDLAPKLFRNRIMNLKGDELLTLSVEEKLNLHIAEELKLSEYVNTLKDKFIKKGGAEEEFFRSVGLEIVNSPVKEGQIVFANITDSAEVHNAAEKIINFEQKIIQNAKKYKALPEDFGTDGVMVDRYVVDENIANAPVFALKEMKKTNKVAEGHIIRKYDKEQIIEKRDKVKELLNKDIILNNGQTIQKEADSQEEIKKTIKRTFATLSGYDIDIDNVSWSDIHARDTATIQREIAIADNVLLKEGLLDYNPILNHVAGYRKTLVRTELNRIAMEKGYANWDAYKEEMFINKARETLGNIGINADLWTDTKNIQQKLVANRDAMQYNLNLLDDAESLLMGDYQGRAKINKILSNNEVLKKLASLKGVQYVTMLGQMAWSCLSDASQLILRKNFGRGLKRLFQDFSKGVFNASDELVAMGLDKAHFSKSAQQIRKFKLNTKEDIEQAFGFLDYAAINNRFSDLDTTHSPEWVDRLARFAGDKTGLNLIVSSLKKSAAEGEYSVLIQECLKGAEADRKYLNRMGISEEFQKIIADTWQLRGTKNNGVYYVDTDLIPNEELRNQLLASIQSIADQTIVTPGLGDVPRFIRSPAGSLFFMFKSYPFLIYNNFFRPMFRGYIEKSTFASVVAASLSLSTARLFVINAVNGKESDPESADFWKEVVDYSNLTNYFVDTIMTYDKVFNRKYNNDVVSQLSPPIANFNRLISAFANLKNGGNSYRTLRNLTPGLNFWWARPLTNPLLPEVKRRKKHRIL